MQEAKRQLQRQDRILASFPEVKSVFGKAGRAESPTDPAPLSMVKEAPSAPSFFTVSAEAATRVSCESVSVITAIFMALSGKIGATIVLSSMIAGSG